MGYFRTLVWQSSLFLSNYSGKDQWKSAQWCPAPQSWVRVDWAPEKVTLDVGCYGSLFWTWGWQSIPKCTWFGIITSPRPSVVHLQAAAPAPRSWKVRNRYLGELMFSLRILWRWFRGAGEERTRLNWIIPYPALKFATSVTNDDRHCSPPEAAVSIQVYRNS